MSFTNPWINIYNSVMDLTQDPTTGMLKGTYRSTTDGSGTYDVVGWASLTNPTADAGQTMAIAILWRSNDGGKSDPSHEVSGMAGQAVLINPVQNLSLMHLFVETDPNSGMALGFYPDKLIFTPTTIIAPASSGNRDNLANPTAPAGRDGISGTWKGSVDGKMITLTLSLFNPLQTNVEGSICYSDGGTYPIAGFTDIFAAAGKLNWQGLSFSTYIDGSNGRTSITMAGYLNLATNKISLIRFSAQSTKPDSTWEQVMMQPCDFEKES